LRKSGFPVRGPGVLTRKRSLPRYSLPALLSGRVYFTSIVISRPFVTIAQDGAGRWSYEGLFPASKATRHGGGFNIIIGAVSINNGSVSMKHRNEPAALDITGITVSASAGITGDTSDIHINALSANGGAPSLAIKAMSGSVQVKGPDLSVKGFQVRTEYSDVKINGTVTDMNRPVFDLTVDCPAVSLKDIGALVPGIRPAGEFSSV